MEMFAHVDSKTWERRCICSSMTPQYSTELCGAWWQHTEVDCFQLASPPSQSIPAVAACTPQLLLTTLLNSTPVSTAASCLLMAFHVSMGSTHSTSVSCVCYSTCGSDATSHVRRHVQAGRRWDMIRWHLFCAHRSPNVRHTAHTLFAALSVHHCGFINHSKSPRHPTTCPRRGTHAQPSPCSHQQSHALQVLLQQHAGCCMVRGRMAHGSPCTRRRSHAAPGSERCQRAPLAG